MKNICGVMVTYNPTDITIESFKSVIDKVDFLYIVDNSDPHYNQQNTSNDTPLSKITSLNQYHSKVELIINGSNLGIATALNIGVKKALDSGYEWILTLDQDSLVEPDMIDKMKGAYYASPDKPGVGFLAPVHFDRKTGYQSKFFRGIKGPYTHRDIVMSSGNLIPASTFKTVGFFDDDLFIDLVDHDFCLRVGKAGLKILLVSEARLSHQLGNIRFHQFLGLRFFTHNYSSTRRYYMSRNRIILFKRHFKWGWVLQDNEFFIKELFKILFFEEDSLAKLKAVLMGTFDGLTNRMGKLEGATYNTPKAFKYFVEFREEIVPLLPQYSAKVMDLGCGSGETSAHLKSIGRFGWVCGVEGNPNAASIAQKKLDAVLIGDIEKMEFPYEANSFDAILALDILEHLVDPWTVLERLTKLLKPEGVLVASLPNVQHYSILVPLLVLGDWKYQQEGLLDSTHIRFFTRKSAIQFLTSTGMVLVKTDYTGAKKPIAKFINLVTFNVFRDFMIFQNLIKVRKK